MTLILVFAIMFLLFMSFKVGVIGMLPNCFPIIVSFGVMGWLGIPLSLATSLIASIAIGLAVDDTIHYLVCYNREFKRDLDKERALRETIQHVGRPIIFTTITISVGFSILMFSNFKPTAVFGLLMVITMFSALVADLILLPSLMLHVELVTIWDLLKLKLGKDPQKGIPLFDGLSRTQVHYILMAGALRTYEAGQVIMEKGEVSDSMYAVISGELDVVNVSDEARPDGASGIRQFIARVRPGDVVGEMGMIRSCARSATVIASSFTELLEINKEMIKRLQWLYPPTAHRFFFNLMTMLCDRLEGLTESFLKATTIEGLTGLYTRDFFVGVLDKEIARSRRYKTPLSLLMVGLDNFDEMNRLYGHQAANIILTDTVRLLNQNVRKTDLVCQYNVDQFAIILTHTPRKVADAFGERIKGLLQAHRFQVDSNYMSLTVTLGLTSLGPDSEKGVRVLIADALQALKETKKDG
jgi:diguanylate cyclase (GGDEF)-like protein